MTIKHNLKSKSKIDDKSAIPQATKPKIPLTRFANKAKNIPRGKSIIVDRKPTSEKSAKLVPFTQKLLNITDPKELEKALDGLTPKQFEQYEKALDKKLMMFPDNSFNYIKWYHRLYLWLFPLHVSMDVSRGVSTKIFYKLAFGNYFLMNESTKEYRS